MMGVGYTKGRGKSGGSQRLKVRRRLEAATERRDKKKRYESGALLAGRPGECFQ